MYYLLSIQYRLVDVVHYSETDSISETVSNHYIRISDRLCGLVVRVPGSRTEMYCASCEVRTEFIFVM
jgi:hypothetical protein